MGFSKIPRKNLIELGFISLIALFAPVFFASEARAEIVVEKSTNFGIIKGVVRDEKGNPIADAVVAIYRAGAAKILKEVRSARDGSFLAKVLPGTYKVLAVADGFNPSTVSDVQVDRSAELNYGFKLERAGSGNTLPEKRVDRNSTKWRVRAAQSRRSIYQANEGEIPVAEKTDAGQTIAQVETEETISAPNRDETLNRRGQTVIETYFAGTVEGDYQGFNFATLQPLGENTEIIISGQTGTKSFASSRFETALKTRLNDDHQIRLKVSGAKLGAIKGGENHLGQISFQALDEWKVREGVVLVFGLDYSRFVGAGNDSSLAPRFGLQFDLGSKTRFQAAYTTQNEERTWARAIELEDSAVFFRDQLASQPVAFEDDKPLMNKSRRLEFGIERVLDNNSNLMATAFFDTVSGRGVGLVGLPLDALSEENFAPFTVEQQGGAQGVRVVYTRRFGSIFSASAGYAFGRGQRLSADAISNPADIFENSYFQTFVGEINTDLRTGTQIKTIFRFSPEATIFAIDPFQGRMAIYDPSLSILITQPLPNLGLPIRAEARFDARNILDTQTIAIGEQGSLLLNSQRRSMRGGISVRF
jgi:hypothetical protein